MEQGRLSRAQKLVLVLMTLALVAVIIALASLVRRSATASPLPTSEFRIAEETPSRPIAPTPSPIRPTQEAPTVASIGVSADVVAARRIEALGPVVSQLRELPKQQEVALNFLTDEQVASYLRGMLADSQRRAFVERQQALLAALDLVPDAEDALPPAVIARAGHVISFYDAREGQIFVSREGRDSQSPDISLIHQYAHAITDQHFDHVSFANRAPDADAVRARDALIEGDAVTVLALHSFGGVGQANLDELAAHLSQAELTDYEGYRTSRAMSDLLLFPYREGAQFVGALLQQGWWPAVNAAYLDPPVSTEQVLHPEKYIGTPRDRPRTVRLPDLSEELGDGWRLVERDVVGELVLRAHIDQYHPDTEEAVAAAAGWDGDLAVLWQDSDDREVLALRILWDTVEEADEFTRIYATVIDRRLRGARVVVRPILPSFGRWWRGETGSAYLQQEDDDVLVIWAPDTDTMEQVLNVFLFEEGP